jgi:2-keto-4-pentenoate hydratase/2-oxohepta-3-ene-1,7-dioic acid hydratase in catechol pathway
MRTVRFRDPAGSTRTGAWTDDGIEFAGRTYAPGEVTVLPPVDPTKIVCVGLNYHDHAEERGKEVPDRPLLFLKPPNALSSHGSTVTLPSGKERIDYEAEFCIVIGEQCRGVDAEDATDVIAGYTCMNDISNRDDQDVEQNWVRGKAFDNSAPLGPVVADPEDVPDDADAQPRVNGETRQDSSIAQLIWSVEEIVEVATEYLTLEPGDVIATGTPPGVGPLADGDHVAIEIEGIGTLEHDVQIP